MAYRRKSPEERLAELEERKRQITAQMQREAARIRERARKDDTRRKIIAGALALEHQDPDFQATLRRLLNKYVKAEDRALFDLDPLPDETSNASATSHSFNALRSPG